VVRVCVDADIRSHGRSGAGPRGAGIGGRYCPASAGPGATRADMFGFQMPVSVKPLVILRFAAMGSTAEVQIVGDGGVDLADWARARIEQLEASWSRFRQDSELNRICRLAGAGPVLVSAEMVEAISCALQLWYVTNGRFDATIRTALEACGYDQTFRQVAPTGPPVPVCIATPGCDGVRLDRDRATVTLPANVQLDLGGIGKGLAADLIATGLVERGASGACVALGGDVRVTGSSHDGRAWSIPIEDPLDESRTLCTTSLVDQAVVTSTTRFRRWRRGNTTMHHLIDPATGAPARRGATAVVAQSAEAWWAEGVAKAALVSGIDDGLDLLERLGVAAVVVGDDDTYRCTSRWEGA
jgi:thiamine biosynthesis lipoprotein